MILIKLLKTASNFLMFNFQSLRVRFHSLESNNSKVLENMIRSCPQIFTGSKHTNQSYKKNLTVAKLLLLLNAVIHNRSTTFIHLSYIYQLLSTIRSKAREKGTKQPFALGSFPSFGELSFKTDS